MPGGVAGERSGNLTAPMPIPLLYLNYLGQGALILADPEAIKSPFSWMFRNADTATAFFKIPPNRVVELGAQVELS